MRKFGHRDRYVQKEDDWRDTGRRWWPSESQEIPTATRSWESSMKQTLLWTLQREYGPACQHLDFRFLASRTWDNTFLLFWSTQFAGLCYGSPRKRSLREDKNMAPTQIAIKLSTWLTWGCLFLNKYWYSNLLTLPLPYSDTDSSTWGVTLTGDSEAQPGWRTTVCLPGPHTGHRDTALTSHILHRTQEFFFHICSTSVSISVHSNWLCR